MITKFQTTKTASSSLLRFIEIILPNFEKKSMISSSVTDELTPGYFTKKEWFRIFFDDELKNIIFAFYPNTHFFFWTLRDIQIFFAFFLKRNSFFFAFFFPFYINLNVLLQQNKA